MNNIAETILRGKPGKSGFQGYVKDRHVVLVGPSRTILKMNQGEAIDEYDIVVRVNAGLRSDDEKKFELDIGTRLDVLYLGTSFRNLPGKSIGSEALIVERLRSRDVRFVIESDNNLRYGDSG